MKVKTLYHGSWGWGVVYILLLPAALVTFLIGVPEALRYSRMGRAEYDAIYNDTPPVPFKW